MSQPTSYCSTSDVESILSVHGLTAYIDDDSTYARDGSEATLVSDAITRAAVIEINYFLCDRYDLTLLSSNDWVKWTNAIFAARQVAMRRMQAVPTSLAETCDDLKNQLREIRRRTGSIPGEAEHYNDIPSMTNYDFERYRGVIPARVQVEESVGGTPAGGMVRRYASQAFYYE